MPSRNTIEIIISAKDHASSVVSGSLENVSKLGKIAAIGLGAVTVAAGLAGKAFIDMAKDASQLQGIEEAFEGITKSAGKSSDAILKAFKENSAGMMTNKDAMLAYNKAAQLVSTTFADTLPDAMKYLSKIASATGQDVGFLSQSLVTGIGRLSPMILDNLGIQVDLNEAYEVYAQSIGKSVDELTKQEQQTALTNQVMEKLKANTAGMPEVAGQADTMMAALEATFEDLRGEMGMKLLPALTKILDVFGDFINRIGPGLMDFVDKYVVPAFEAVGGLLDILLNRDFSGGIFGLDEDHPIITLLISINDFFRQIGAGMDIWRAFMGLLHNVIKRLYKFGMISEDIWIIFRGITGVIHSVMTQIMNWINANIQLGDVLKAIGIVIASIVIPAIWGVITAASPLLFTFGLIVGAVALVRRVFETDFLGIRTFVEETIGKIADFFQPILDALNQFWMALDAGVPFVDAIRVLLFDLFGPVAASQIIGFVGQIGQTISNLWETIRPALENLWRWFTQEALPAIINFIETKAIPFINELIRVLGGIWEGVKGALISLWDWFLVTGWPWISQAISDFKTYVLDPVIKLLQDIWTQAQPGLNDMYTWFTETGLPFVEDAINAVVSAITDVITEITNWAAKNPELAKIAIAMGGVAAAGVLIVNAMNAIKAVSTVVSGAFSAFSSLAVVKIAAVTAAVLATLAAINEVKKAMEIYNAEKARAEEAASTALASGQTNIGALRQIEQNAVSSQQAALQQQGLVGNVASGIIGVMNALGAFNTTPNVGLPTQAQGQAPGAPGSIPIQGGNTTNLAINFNGTGGPATPAQAQAMSTDLVNALRAMGVDLTR